MWRKGVTRVCPVAQLYSALAIPWTVACQVSLFMDFSMDFPLKNTGVSCRFLLRRIFPTQGSNLISCIVRQVIFTIEPNLKNYHTSSNSTLSSYIKKRETLV